MADYSDEDHLLRNEVNGSADNNAGHGGTTSVTQDRYGSTHVLSSPSALSRESAQDRLDRLTSMQGGDESSAMSFHDINYSVHTKVQACGKAVRKDILTNVNGIFKPGMNALMGPTGSGKSSLLDVLAGRKEPQGLKGTILLDGLPPPDNFKVLVGYVSQDDRVTGMLTIRENFAFSAALRLPKTVSKKERNERVDQVIKELGLNDVADSKVGNEFIRGISGGERKRCNIGMELIISPPVLFLDEPTTGLDASTANAVMLLLKKLAQRGRTIIFAIHQPRYSIYRLFDSLMLLSKGQVVYHGPCKMSLDYFKTLGFECDTFNNPADFFLDVINGDSTAITSLSGDKPNGTLVDNPGENRDHTIAVEDNHQEFLITSYKKSNIYKDVKDELDPIMENLRQEEASGNLVHIRKVNYKTSFLDQLFIVSGRAVKSLVRNPQIYAMQFFVIMIFAAIVGTVYFRLDNSVASGIQNRVGAFFFIIMNQIFGNMSAVELFIKERAIFIHENTSGFYRVSAYFLAKVFCDVIPLRMIPACIFSAVAYYMIGFRDGVEHFFIFALVLFLTALAASGLSFFISSSVRIFAVANLCLALCYVFMMLFSGLLVNVGDLLDWLAWIKYLSIFRYSLNALDINELKDHMFCGNTTAEDSPGCVPMGANYTCISGNSYLVKQNIDFESDWDLWKNVMALGIMVLVFMFMSYVQLRRLKKLN